MKARYALVERSQIRQKVSANKIIEMSLNLNLMLKQETLVDRLYIWDYLGRENINFSNTASFPSDFLPVME